MEIRDIRYAIASLDLGGFAQAAKVMFVSRQAISQSVHRLENELGISLFEVVGNRLVPTAGGQDFFKEARSVLDAFDLLALRFGTADALSIQGKPPTIGIAVGAGVPLVLPLELINRLRSSLSGRVHSFVETSADGALASIRDGDAGVAFIYTSPKYLGDLDYALVLRTGLWVALPPGSPLCKRSELLVADMDGKRIITTGRSNHPHRFLFEACEREGVDMEVSVTSTNAALLRRIAIERRLLHFSAPPALLTRACTQFEALRGDGSDDSWAVLPLMAEGAQEFGVYAVRARSAKSNDAVRLLWDYLRTDLTRLPALA